MNEHKLPGAAVAVGALVGGLGVMVLGFGAGLYVGRSLRLPQTSAPTTCVCGAPQRQKAKLVVRTQPTGASVYFVDGSRPAGKTPLELEVPFGDPAFDLKVTLPGYKPEFLAMRPDLDRDYLLSLTPETSKRPDPDCDDIEFLAPSF